MWMKKEQKKKGSVIGRKRETWKQEVATEKEWRDITLTPAACLLLHTVLLKNRGRCREGGMDGEENEQGDRWLKEKSQLFACREKKSFLGLWPTSLSLPVTEKWKEAGKDGWRGRMRQRGWGGGRALVLCRAKWLKQQVTGGFYTNLSGRGRKWGRRKVKGLQNYQELKKQKGESLNDDRVGQCLIIYFLRPLVPFWFLIFYNMIKTNILCIFLFYVWGLYELHIVKIWY